MLLRLFAILGVILTANSLDGQTGAAVCGEITSYYDAGHDKTIVQLEPVALDSTTRLSVLATFSGRAIHRPDNDVVVLMLWTARPISASPGAVPMEVRVKEDSVVWSGAGYPQRNNEDGGAHVLIAGLPLRVWRAILDAENPILVMADSRFPIGPQVMRAIIDYDSRLTP
jgi:hypothetical protein